MRFFLRAGRTQRFPVGGSSRSLSSEISPLATASLAPCQGLDAPVDPEATASKMSGAQRRSSSHGFESFAPLVEHAAHAREQFVGREGKGPPGVPDGGDDWRGDGVHAPTRLLHFRASGDVSRVLLVRVAELEAEQPSARRVVDGSPGDAAADEEVVADVVTRVAGAVAAPEAVGDAREGAILD